MKLDKIKLEELLGDNIFSYEDIYINFSKYRNSTTIFLGLNLDMGEDANAAGKTNILKIIHFGFYGKDKKATLDDMIHQNNPDRGFCIQLSFSSGDGKQYKITRFYRYNNKQSKIKLVDGSIPKGSGIEFVIDGHRFFIEKDNKAIQSMIQKTIGISSTIFLSSVLTEQRKYKTFLDETDSDKKEFLSKLLDLTEFDDAYEYTKKFVSSLEMVIKDMSAKKEKYENIIKDHEKSITIIKENKIKKEKEKEIKIKSLNEKLDNLRRLQKTFSDSSELNRKTTDKIKQIKDTLENIKKRKKELEYSQDIILFNKKIEDTILLNQSKVDILLKQKDSIKKEYDILSEKIKILTSQINNIVVNPEELQDIEKKIQEMTLNIKKIQEIETKKHSISITLSKIDSKKNELIQQNNQLEEKIKHTNTKKECPECHSTLSEDDQKFTTLIQKNKLKIKENSSEIIKISAEINRGKEWIENSLKYINQKDSIQKSIDELNNKKTEKQKEIDKKNNLKKEEAYYSDDASKKTLLIKKCDDEIQHLLKENEESKSKIKKVLITPSVEEIKEIDNKILEKTTELNKYETDIRINNEKMIRKQQNESQIKDTESQINDLILETDESSSLQFHHENEINSYKKALELTIEDIHKKLEELRYYSFWKKGFSPTGIKSFITEDVINMINVKGNEFLHFISDGILSIKLEPQVESDKGIISNKISTKFYEGAELIKDGLISGGQYQRFILAIDLAISAIVEEKCKSRFDMKFIDEHFDGISTKGQKMALKLFSKQAKERSGFFLISHDKELQQFCDNAIYIIKENKVSKIVDRETFLKKGQQKK